MYRCSDRHSEQWVEDSFWSCERSGDSRSVATCWWVCAVTRCIFHDQPDSVLL